MSVLWLATPELEHLHADATRDGPNVSRKYSFWMFHMAHDDAAWQIIVVVDRHHIERATMRVVA
jgi:hypothetical protein